jgi:hypothetical protein
MHWLALVTFAGASGLAEADRRAKSSFSSYRSHQSSSSIAVQSEKMTVAEILAQNKQLAVLAEQIAAAPQQQLGRTAFDCCLWQRCQYSVLSAYHALEAHSNVTTVTSVMITFGVPEARLRHDSVGS